MGVERVVKQLVAAQDKRMVMYGWYEGGGWLRVAEGLKMGSRQASGRQVSDPGAQGKQQSLTRCSTRVSESN